uniref:Coiled-coil and C2 domain containing 2B n=1 Tax=Callorhinchus milii TaxID=7868 RepID=A0A4W3JXK9_CALMI
ESKLDLYLSDYLLSDILERVPKLLDISKQILFLVPSSSKLPENVEPRYLEEEGFHICHKPYVLKKNLNKMENRLLKQTEKEDWFGEDGNMIALPDPIKKLWNYTLPTSYLSDDFESKLETVYRKAVKSDSGHHIVTTIRATHIYQLDIDISSLRFTHHPLFSKEHVLAARLTQLYNNYQHRQQQNVTEVLTEKVSYLVAIDFECMYFRETRRLLAVEREKDHTLIKNILTVWKQIKSLRKFQQCICTPVKLQGTTGYGKGEKSVDEYTDYDLEKTPEPSAPLDRAAIEAMVKRRYKLISRQRDELILIPELSLTADVTLISKCFCDLNTIDAIASIGVSWLNDIQKLAEWAKKARIDPHDPQNSTKQILYQHALQYFRLEQMQEEFNFVTDKEMEKSKRFLLLILRDSGVSEYSYFKQVPPYDKEIPDSIFQVKATVVKRLLTVKHQYTLADIVVESAEVSTISIISKAILNLITPRQNLKPLRKERKKVPVQTLSDGDIKMLINIITAYNIPMRKCISRSPNGDYNGAMLCKMKDKIFINVFDSVILENIEVSGTFKMNTPPMLLGYTWKKKEAGSCEEYFEFGLTEGSLLTLFITLDPQISCLDEVSFHFIVEEVTFENIYIRIQHRNRSFGPTDLRRSLITSVIDSECRVGFVTRYIRPLAPSPQLLEAFPKNSQATLRLIARFVSLIPFIPSSLKISNSCNIWLTSQQFLNLAVGDEAEHAVLLCNYFLHMGMKAFIILGNSIFAGATVNVITQEKTNTMIWNPETGECFEQFNAFCSLQTVGSLINNENIWFNVQKNNNLMNVSFDVSRENNWHPFFRKSSSHRVLTSVQVSGFPIQMRYTELQMIIEKVNSTGVHNIDLPNIEFALAVYIHPYPNNILSVWIYVASLFPDI